MSCARIRAGVWGVVRMLRFEIKDGPALSAADKAAWTKLLTENNAVPSPYLTPEFYEAVAQVRPSARVLVGHQAGVPVLFFPFHRNGIAGAAGLGHAIGGPVNDVQGVIARGDIQLDARALMRAAGLSLLSLKHAAGVDPAFARGNPGALTRHAGHVMDLSAGFAAYEQDRTPFAKSAFKALRTRQAKAEVQYGPVSHRFWDAEAASLDALMKWKRQQFEATGQTNVLEVDWVNALVRSLMNRPIDADLRVQISSLSFGDRLVAVHLGLRTATTLHYWFPAYDAAVQELSPGNILLYRMAEQAAHEGVRQIHLGAGDYRYKHEFANCSMPLIATTILAPSLPGRMAGAGAQVMGLLERGLPAKWALLPGGALRRLDRHLAFRAL
jgi:CelD/BcsL family acetyltransferase involved in cellulose biosynthesis